MRAFGHGFWGTPFVAFAPCVAKYEVPAYVTVVPTLAASIPRKMRQNTNHMVRGDIFEFSSEPVEYDGKQTHPRTCDSPTRKPMAP